MISLISRTKFSTLGYHARVEAYHKERMKESRSVGIIARNYTFATSIKTHSRQLDLVTILDSI